MLIIWQVYRHQAKKKKQNQELKDSKIFYAGYKLEKLKLIF